MDSAEVILVIKTTTLRGTGANDADPMRPVTQFWALSGELLAEVDPFKQETTK